MNPFEIALFMRCVCVCVRRFVRELFGVILYPVSAIRLAFGFSLSLLHFHLNVHTFILVSMRARALFQSDETNFWFI